MDEPVITAGQRLLAGGVAYIITRYDDVEVWVRTSTGPAWTLPNYLEWDSIAGAWRTDRRLSWTVPGQIGAFG